MVGYDPYAQFELSTFEYGLAGVLSGLITRALCQPLDVIKIRFQLQVDPVKKLLGGKYHNISQALVVICKEEGGVALWKGHVPAQGLSVVFGVVQFGSYELLTKGAHLYLPERTFSLFTDKLPVVPFVCGAISGGLSMTAALPFDVLRTRLVAQGEPKLYNGIVEAVYKMYTREGVRSFYRGFVPTVLQTAPYTGLQFTFYTAAVKAWDKFVERTREYHTHDIGAFESFICGSFAGIAAKTTVYPLDVLKKRLQTVGFEEARLKFGTVHRYHGLLHCIRSIMKHEGYVGMFKGLWPSMVKAAVASGCGLMIYEQACRVLVASHSGS